MTREPFDTQGEPMRRTSPLVALVLAIASTAIWIPTATADERSPAPVVPLRDQASYVAKAVAFGIPRELAQQALYNETLYLGLPVEVVEESGPIAADSPTGSVTADDSLAAAVDACGPIQGPGRGDPGIAMAWART